MQQTKCKTIFNFGTGIGQVPGPLTCESLFQQLISLGILLKILPLNLVGFQERNNTKEEYNMVSFIQRIMSGMC